MAILEMQGVRKRFGATLAVDGLDLAIPAGEVHALLGPNGAGKSTSIRMVAGLLRPDEGRIRVGGHDVVADGLAARRLLAYVPDEPSLYERLTGREFLAFTARIYGLDPGLAGRRIDEAAERFALHGFLDRLAEGYSHGQRQRVVLAAAMLHEPLLVIVDEPLVGLDPLHIRVVIDWLREVAARGGAVLMSTHTLSTVEGSCQRGTVMDHGRAIAGGSIAELRAGGDLEERFLALTAGGPVPDRTGR